MIDQKRRNDNELYLARNEISAFRVNELELKRKIQHLETDCGRLMAQLNQRMDQLNDDMVESDDSVDSDEDNKM